MLLLRHNYMIVVMCVREQNTSQLWTTPEDLLRQTGRGGEGGGGGGGGGMNDMYTVEAEAEMSSTGTSSSTTVALVTAVRLLQAQPRASPPHKQ